MPTGAASAWSVKVTGMTERSCSLTKMQRVPLAAAAAVCLGTASLAQTPDVTKPPPVLNSAASLAPSRPECAPFKNPCVTFQSIRNDGSKNILWS
jgi:hypothetical protein